MTREVKITHLICNRGDKQISKYKISTKKWSRRIIINASCPTFVGNNQEQGNNKFVPTFVFSNWEGHQIIP